MAEPADTYEEAQRAAYLAPESVEEALAMLAEHGEGAKPIAGGQSLLILLRWGLAAPTYLVGLKRIPELTHLAATPEGGLTIGAMVTQHALETSPLVRTSFPALADAAGAVASPPVRRQATIGGNLCHADPAADPPAALIALGAEVEIAHRGGRRRLPVAELFRGFLDTAIGPDELLVAIHIPPAGPRTGTAYLKHRVRGVDYALVGVGFGLTLAEDGQTCAEARIGLAGVGDTPLRAMAAEAVLHGQPVTEATLRASGEAAAAECHPPSDTEGSEWYRREMVKVFVGRAGVVALQRARDVNVPS
ncbi:MAG: aerobic carbon-monoxide dehydrogenase medium subunit [Thermomicrobiales bacterium]|nr:aerobic carbon-monoxide dehydrogenase medium subunit [Thermomicrobiales bacterium]